MSAYIYGKDLNILDETQFFGALSTFEKVKRSFVLIN